MENWDAATELRLCDGWLPNASSTWNESDVPEDAMLHGSTNILGTPFHVRAIRVLKDPGGAYKAEDEVFEEDLENAYALNGDAPFCTVNLDGHEGEYVLLIYPHTL
jgi:hypothetical protein